jgi:hypothetical protein
MAAFNTREAAAFVTSKGVRTAPQTLNKLRVVGGGPVFRRAGTRVVYFEADLVAWVNSRLSPPMKSTSEMALREPSKPRQIGGA